MLDTLLKLDGDILLWIQDNLRAGWLDPIMKFITYLANGGALWIGICVLLLILKKTRTSIGEDFDQNNRHRVFMLPCGDFSYKQHYFEKHYCQNKTLRGGRGA